MKSAAFVLTAFVLIAAPTLAVGGDHPLQGYPGVQGKVWKKTPYADSLGRHMVVLSHTGLYQSRPDPAYPDNVCGNSDIYAYGFDGDGAVPPALAWTMHDFVHDCETSATAEFSQDSPVITDLDGDGVSEVWITYYVSCHGDVSPDGMKVLMYEGGKKHALRGETFLHVDGMDLGGAYRADPAFNEAPAAIRRFGDELWRRNMRRR